MSSNVQKESEIQETEKEKLAIKSHEGEEEYLDFVEGIRDQTAKVGETVTFEAIIISKPNIWVDWTFNNQDIKEGHDNFVMTSKGNHYQLTIKKMTPDTVGCIEIVARNNVGVAVIGAKLSLNDDSTSDKTAA